MTDIYADNFASNTSRNKGEMKTVFETLQSVIQEMLGGGAEASTGTGTLAGDSITPVADSCVIPLTPQLGTSDDLSTIVTTNTRNGQIVAVRNNDVANTIRVRHGVGNIYLIDGVDRYINNTDYYILFIRRGSTWRELGANDRLTWQTLYGMKEETGLTIASGLIIPTQGAHRVDTEGALSADDLDGASSSFVGNFFRLRCTNAARVVTVRSGQTVSAGYYKFITRDGASAVLNNINQYIDFQRDTTNTAWREVGRSGFIQPLSYGGTGADLSGAALGTVFYKGASGLTGLGPVSDKYLRFNTAGDALITADVSAGGRNYFGSGADGTVTISANTTVGDATNDNDFVIMQYDTLTIDATRNLTTQARKRCLLVYVKNHCTINGTLHMNAKGASAAGTVINLYKFDQSSQTFSSETGNQAVLAQTNYSTPAAGSGGGAGGSGGNGTAGTAGTGGGTGGGGGGGGGGAIGAGGAGAAGTAYSGGAGGGGGGYSGGGTAGTAGAANGGAGGAAGTCAAGFAAGGGAGSTAGAGSGTTGNAATAGTGGTLYLLVGGNLTIGAAGVVSANGSAGGGSTGGNNYNTGGGGSGGGKVGALYAGTLSNSGTVQASGGSGGTASGASSGNWTGGAGGAGSVSGPTKIAAA